jgi:hypothetical protein
MQAVMSFLLAASTSGFVQSGAAVLLPASSVILSSPWLSDSVSVEIYSLLSKKDDGLSEFRALDGSFAPA